MYIFCVIKQSACKQIEIKWLKNLFVSIAGCELVIKISYES